MQMAADYGTPIISAWPYWTCEKAKIRWRSNGAHAKQSVFLTLAIEYDHFPKLTAEISDSASQRLGASRALFDARAFGPQAAAGRAYVAERKECRVGLDYYLDSKKHFTRNRTNCCAKGFGRASPHPTLKSSTDRRPYALIVESQAHDAA